MKYKLSNIASITLLRQELGIDVKYPAVYKPKLKIDGNKEQSLSIVTMDNPNELEFGIWGVLPHFYEGSWQKFQKIKNTLHVKSEAIFTNVLYREALLKRRCLIVVTGFYTHHLKGNMIRNFLVEKEPLRPFYLAGIYNVLEDGFLSCTVINTDANKELSSINNLYDVMPLQIPKLLKNVWLNKETSLKEIKHILSKPYETNFNINEIASTR